MVVICKVASSSDLQLIENYVKNVKYIDAIDVNISCFSQSKFYLKIIGILYYFYNDLSKSLLSNNIKEIIKQNQIFNNIVLASKLYVIKI